MAFFIPVFKPLMMRHNWTPTCRRAEGGDLGSRNAELWKTTHLNSGSGSASNKDEQKGGLLSNFISRSGVFAQHDDVE